MKIKEEVSKEFGEVKIKTCSFCDKTYDIDNFYSIPNDDEDGALNLMRASLYATIGKKQKKEVNDGICLKCILRGLLKICNNDKEKVNTFLSLYLKEKIVDNLKN